jgi:SHS2 domain-containing protein
MEQTYTPKKEGIRYLDHTADIWLSVEADNLEDLFMRSIEGLYGIIAEEYLLSGGSDLSAENLIFQRSAVSMKEQNSSFELKLSGRAYNFEIPEGKGGIEIKAITYHDAQVKSDMNGMWQMKLLLDL